MKNNLFYRFGAVLLILLHLLIFGPMREAGAFYAESTSLRLNNAQLNQGSGVNRIGTSFEITDDVIGESFSGGEFAGNSFVLTSGIATSLTSYPPVVKAIPYQAWATGQSKENAFDLDDYFSSPDNLFLTYKVTGNSNINVTIDPVTHIVSFSQRSSWFGIEKIYFLATDSQGNSTTSNHITLQVTNPSNPATNKPAIVEAVVSPTSINEGATVTLTVKAINAGAGNLVFSYSGGLFQETNPPEQKDGYWISTSTWQTPQNSTGHYNVIVTTSTVGPNPLTDSENVVINVGKTNHAPIMVLIADIFAQEGDLVDLSSRVSITDADQDVPRIYYPAPFDSRGFWQTGFDDAKIYNLAVTASDGIDTVSKPVKIIVANKNRQPNSPVLSLNHTTIKPNESIDISLTVSDPDKEDTTLTYSLKQDDVEFAAGTIANNGSVVKTKDFPNIGYYKIKVILTDAAGASSAKEVNLQVDNPNPDVSPIMGDFDGNSLTDLGIYKIASGVKEGVWEISLSQKGQFQGAREWISGFGNREWIPMGGDFNGDGKTDAAVYNSSSGEFKIALSNGAAFATPTTWVTVSFAASNWQPFTGNFNGDKYTDIAFYNRDNGEVRVYLGTGSSFGAYTTWISNFGNQYTAMTGDFNGDSLSDLCLFKKDSGEFKVAFSNTTAFVDGSTWLSNFANNKDPLLSDFNNDSFADVGYWDKDAGRWYYAIAKRDKFESKGVWLENFGSSTDQSATTGDFNGDGISDPAVFNKNETGIIRWKTQISQGRPADLLNKIDNGTGGDTRITYSYASEAQNHDVPFPIYVASSISSNNNFPVSRAATYIQNFSFSGGYYDFQDREFRGFAMAQVTDPVTGNYTQTYFYQGKDDSILKDEAAKKGQIREIKAFVRGSLEPVSQTINEYDVKKAGPQDRNLGFPALVRQTTTVREEGGANLTSVGTYTYDNIGNVTEEVAYSGTVDQRSTTTAYTQAYSMSPTQQTGWVGFNRPQEVTLKDRYGVIATKKNFQYDDKGNLYKEIVDIINPITRGIQCAISEYAYDSFGNVISKTDALGRSLVTEYEDEFYAYLKKVTNALGQTIEYEYDTKLGAVTSVKDTNGQTSSTAYDSYGRIWKVYNVSNSLVSTYSYPNFNTKTVIKPFNLTSSEYYDGLGRKYKTESSGEYGDRARKVVSEVFYNSRGLADYEELPHYENETDPNQFVYTRYVYDKRGRVTQTISDVAPHDFRDGNFVIDPEKDAVVQIEYLEPLKTKVIDPLHHEKISIKDVYGNVSQVIEPGGPVTKYTYDLQNNLIQTEDAKGNRTQITYDSTGRKIKMIDPDMGEWSYEYDLVGNLIKQTDTKGQIIEFSYDTLNRLTKKVSLRASREASEAILAEYLYDDTSKPNCIGRLSKVTDQSGSTEFFYDNLGREIKSIKTIDNNAYTVERTYDVLDRLTSLKYPDGELVRYTYNSNSGLLKKVEGSSVYVDTTTYNAKGQIKNISYGNGTQTEYTYGQDLRLSRILTQSPVSIQNLQDLNYTFDLNGNVKEIADNLHSNVRKYKYDDLDRLTEAQNSPDVGGGYTTFNYGYDEIGNMISQTKANGSGLGRMIYGQNAGPHALTSAGGYTYLYDSNGNMTQGKNKAMAYDIENRLTNVNELGKITNFVYDGDGGRVKKFTSSISTTYIGSLYEINSDGKITKHIFAGANRVCSKSVSLRGAVGDEAILYYHSDHLGSSNVISDAIGKQVEYCEYAPYGSVVKNEGSDLVSHKFTGKELDSTGLYFYGARYYDPEIGRFITADTIVQAPYDTQSLNRYSYCRNNPLNYVDPTGHSWFSKFFKKVGEFFENLVKNPVSFIAGFVGGLVFGFVGMTIAKGIGVFLGGASESFFGGAIMGTVEFGMGGFGSGLASGLAGGMSFNEAISNAGYGAAAGAILGIGIEGSYMAGWQNVAHGLSKNELYKAQVDHYKSLVNQGRLQQAIDYKNSVLAQHVRVEVGLKGIAPTHTGIEIKGTGYFDGRWGKNPILPDSMLGKIETIGKVFLGEDVPGKIYTKATGESRYWLNLLVSKDIDVAESVFNAIRTNSGTDSIYNLYGKDCFHWRDAQFRESGVSAGSWTER